MDILQPVCLIFLNLLLAAATLDWVSSTFGNQKKIHVSGDLIIMLAQSTEGTSLWGEEAPLKGKCALFLGPWDQAGPCEEWKKQGWSYFSVG